MGQINWNRVVLGGLLAGVVLIVLATGFTALFIGKQELRTAVQALRPPPSSSAAPLFFLCAFLFLGILMTWWYAAIRPRFGPGPKTATIAGFAVWLAANPAQSFLLGHVAQFPMGFVVKSMAMYLVMFVTSSVAGAWVYKELPHRKR